MVEFTKTIKDPLGLHARPVALLYDIIAKHRSDVSVSIGDRHTDGRDVMGSWPSMVSAERTSSFVFRAWMRPLASHRSEISRSRHDRAR